MKKLIFTAATALLGLFSLAGSNSASAQWPTSCLETKTKGDCPKCLQSRNEAGSSGGFNHCAANWRGPQAGITTTGGQAPRMRGRGRKK